MDKPLTVSESLVVFEEWLIQTIDVFAEWLNQTIDLVTTGNIGDMTWLQLYLVASVFVIGILVLTGIILVCLNFIDSLKMRPRK